MQKLKKYMKPGAIGWLAQRNVRHFPLRNALSSVVARGKPKHDAVDDARVAQGVRELGSEGIHFFKNYLSAEKIEAVRNALDGYPLRERFPPFRSGFDHNDPPADVHVGNYDADVLVQIPEVMEIANDPLLLSIVAQNLGCKPTISDLSVWWSFPTDGSAQEAENYHRDVIDWRFIKFFVYLTDVDSGSGPHRFVRKSQNSTKLRAMRRFTDEEVAENFPEEDRLEITGQAGDAFLENTFGIHKGQPPRTDKRLLLQVQYSINPTAVYEYAPKDIGSHGYDRYSNRLFVQ